MITNYQKILDKKIDEIVKNDYVPTLLLHSCCAPCSTYVLEYLSQYFSITILYYNPNIFPQEEFNKRFFDQEKLVEKLNVKNKVSLIKGDYDSNVFFDLVKGLENLPEGSERCFKCYYFRLEETALLAKKMGIDYFTTTLSISPYKNAQKINELGKDIEDKYGVRFLNADFKKKNGYKRSIELSKVFDLYRQDYCGCVYSKREAQIKRQNII